MSHTTSKGRIYLEIKEKQIFTLYFARFSLPFSKEKILLPKGKECGVALAASRK
jgi:hypothetical protein